MKRLLLQSSAAALLSIFSFAAFAVDDEIFDDRFYVAPMASVSGTRGGVSDTNGIGGSLAIGKSVIPHLSVELIADYLHYKGRSVTTPSTGLLCGLIPCASTTSKYPSERLLVGGAGVNLYFSQSNSGLFIHGDVEGGDRFAFNGGVGYDQAIFGRTAYVRLEVLAHKEIGFDTKPLGHLGVRIPFGSQHHADATATDQPVQVVPVDESQSPEGAVAPESTPLPSDGASSEASPSAPAPASEEQAAPADAVGEAAPAPAADAAPAPEASVSAEPSAEIAPQEPVKRRSNKRHKKAKVAKAPTPEASEPAPTPVEPTTSSSPAESAESNSAPAGEPVPASEPAQTPAPAASAPSDDEAVQTEPAQAPPASKQ